MQINPSHSHQWINFQLARIRPSQTRQASWSSELSTEGSATQSWLDLLLTTAWIEVWSGCVFSLMRIKNVWQCTLPPIHRVRSSVISPKMVTSTRLSRIKVKSFHRTSCGWTSSLSWQSRRTNPWSQPSHTPVKTRITTLQSSQMTLKHIKMIVAQ